MLKYLIIQLDESSISFCHYNNEHVNEQLIDYGTLQKGIIWSMKENLIVQFVYPDYDIPQKYKDLIGSIDHVDIVSSNCKDTYLLRNADIIVFDSLQSTNSVKISTQQTYIIRTTLSKLFNDLTLITPIIKNTCRCNIVITDVQNLNDSHEQEYSQCLSKLNKVVLNEYKKGHDVQLNILTDRMLLHSMNNCGAGDESVTLSPNGKFYICPGFYHDGDDDIGNIDSGLNIKNPQLLKLENSPICRICDAWQCKRCVWLNKTYTQEVNTPSKEQCVVSHIERNASRELLSEIKEFGMSFQDKLIPEIDYRDPFDKLQASNLNL